MTFEEVSSQIRRLPNSLYPGVPFSHKKLPISKPRDELAVGALTYWCVKIFGT